MIQLTMRHLNGRNTGHVSIEKDADVNSKVTTRICPTHPIIDLYSKIKARIGLAKEVTGLQQKNSNH